MRRPVIRLAVSVVVALIAIAAPRPQAQSIPKPLAFEVASVKANKSETDPGGTTDTIPGRFTVSNTPLFFIINYAYDLPGYRLVGAPDWTWDARFNIAATYTPATAPVNQQDVRAMVQRLLVDRFALAAHHEQRDLPVCACWPAVMGASAPSCRRTGSDQWLAEKRLRAMREGRAPSPSKRPACMMTGKRGPIVGGTRRWNSWRWHWGLWGRRRGQNRRDRCVRHRSPMEQH